MRRRPRLKNRIVTAVPDAGRYFGSGQIVLQQLGALDQETELSESSSPAEGVYLC